MFTLKLYRGGPVAPSGKTVIVETAGLWIGYCDHDVKHIRAFKKTVGVVDEDGTPEFYVGGTPPRDPPPSQDGLPSSAVCSIDADYYDWAVLENAMGKTTEIFR